MRSADGSREELMAELDRIQDAINADDVTVDEAAILLGDAVRIVVTLGRRLAHPGREIDPIREMERLAAMGVRRG